MDFSPIINEVFKTWWLIPIFLVLTIIKTPCFKGLFGETFVKLSAKICLPASTYHLVHNVTLPTPDGTTQIDHIIASPYGIFVVETKNIKGWIFGGEKQAQWTQKIFKNSFKFQNPLRQNYKHVKALETALNIAPELIHSVVVFAGESTFKTTMPANVTRGFGYIRYIKSFKTPVLSETEVQNALIRILDVRLAPSRETHRKHVQQLRKCADTTAERICPRCGEPLVLRTAKRGANAGNQFWGCSAYPKCKAMQSVT